MIASKLLSVYFSGSSSHHHQSHVLLEDLEPKKRSKKHKHTHKKRKLEADKETHIVSDLFF